MSSGFIFTDLQTLFGETTEECEFVIEDMLPVSATSLVVAKPKVGKSTFMRNAALAVSRGDPFLGHETKQGPVLYLALEESRGDVIGHFRGMGATGSEAIRLHIGPAPSDPLLALELAISEVRPELVVIDPLQRLMRFRDIADYSEVSSGLEPVVELSRKYRTHISILHHNNKADHSGSPSDGILGSTALFASVDLALIMLKRDEVRTIQTDGPQRFGVDIAPTVLNFDKETGIMAAGGDLSEAKRQDLRQRIINALGDMRLPMLEIKKGVGGDTARTHSEVLSLYADGFLERDGAGVAGSPYVFFVRMPSKSAKANGSHHVNSERDSLTDGRPLAWAANQ